jgi:hypothetical protein
MKEKKVLIKKLFLLMRIWKKQISYIKQKIGMIHQKFLQNVFVFLNMFLTKI